MTIVKWQDVAHVIVRPGQPFDIQDVEPDARYRIQKSDDGRFRCTCEEWRWSGRRDDSNRTCKHIQHYERTHETT